MKLLDVAVKVVGLGVTVGAMAWIAAALVIASPVILLVVVGDRVWPRAEDRS